MLLFLLLYSVNAAIFPVTRRQRLYNDKKTLLTPLFFRLNAIKALTPTKQRRQRRYFAG